MDYRIRTTCAGVDWNEAWRLLDSVRMASHPLDEVRRAFENSHRVVFVYHGDTLLGLGRAVSDGVYEAALYDIAVRPECQGQNIGTLIVRTLMDGLAGMDVIFFAMPGREGFYRKLGFSRLLTGMARFHRAAALREKGFTD
jgi:ribosomal protein S18 acetylase RimI-like enzyme